VVAVAITPPSNTVDIDSEAIWIDLYVSLRSIARFLVYSFHVSSWCGQKEDMIEDVVQETARRLFERVRKAERGEAEPIYSLKHLMITIAQNYCKDLWRSDRRLSLMSPQEDALEPVAKKDEQAHTLDTVTENVFEELLLEAVAHEIANFPFIQRKAILIDLANRMCFDSKPTPLQKAFINEGIQLKQYQLPLPNDPQERSRYASSLCYAYRRVRSLPSIREFMVEAQNNASTTRKSFILGAQSQPVGK
jgi:DNA-directed RNA polymerase specialized sigma24 family protein